MVLTDTGSREEKARLSLPWSDDVLDAEKSVPMTIGFTTNEGEMEEEPTAKFLLGALAELLERCSEDDVKARRIARLHLGKMHRHLILEGPPRMIESV